MATLSPILRRTGLVLGDIALGLGLLWLLGLCIYRPESLISLGVLAAILIWRHRRGRGFGRRATLWLAVVCGALTYNVLTGPADARWQKPWERAPQFRLVGDRLVVRDLRDFRYRSEEDYDAHYRTETFDLNKLTGVDFAECHWDGMELICHTMLSFSFADGRHLVVSPETRLPEGEAQNAIGGIYKRYGLLYVFGTEEDIFALRTNYRHEDLKLYPLKATPAQARALLLRLVELAQRTEERQSPYNTITDNCSSGLVRIFAELAPDIPFGYRLLPLHNGSISRLLYQHGAMRSREGESFDALRRRCDLGYDIAKGDPAGYSAAIREKRERVKD